MFKNKKKINKKFYNYSQPIIFFMKLNNYRLSLQIESNFSCH